VGDRRRPLDEIATREQNAAFADALTQELWTHTSQPDVRVVASLAGGYKTMSALLLSAMQLLANPGDRVTHVLAAAGYDATTPPFYFPGQRIQNLRSREGTRLRASAASGHLRLVDLPVIPLRRWFEQHLNRKPPSYDVLVNGSLAALDQAAGDLALELGPVELREGGDRHWFELAGQRHALSPDRYAYLRFLAERARRDPEPAAKVVDLIDELADWVGAAKDREPRLHHIHETLSPPEGTGRFFSPDDFSKRLGGLRTFLGSLPGGRTLAAALPGRGYWGLKVAPGKITLR
jgi:hypothetical protein